jgi:protease I
MELTGKRFVLLVETIFNDHEFWYPYYRLQEAGAEVTVVGSGSADRYTGKSGTVARVDMPASKVDPNLYDGIIVPGGYAPDHMRRHQAMKDLVRTFDEQGKVVAAICHAGWLLVSAGILKGRTVTSFVAIRDDLVNAGADWVDRDVVRDRNLVTSRTPDDLPVFMRTIIETAAK